MDTPPILLCAKKRSIFWQEGLCSYTRGQNTTILLRRASNWQDTELKAQWHALCHYYGCNSNDACVIATGGYGRRELFPHSDCDIMLLTATPTRSDALCAAITAFERSLWDGGFSPGFSVRSLEDMTALHSGSTKDAQILTSLLEVHYIAGSRNLLKAMQQQIETVLSSLREWFLECKLGEQRSRYSRYSAQYVLEPDIKRSPGALRDVHLLRWLARVLHQAHTVDALEDRGILSRHETQQLKRAISWLNRMRYGLHHVSSRAQEQLRFGEQPELALLLGLRAANINENTSRMMKRYFAATATVRYALQQVIEHHTQRHTPCPALPDSAAEWLRCIIQSIQHATTLHPVLSAYIWQHARTLGQAMSKDATCGAILVDALQDTQHAGVIFRYLRDSGLLLHILPNTRHLVAQMQYDGYHRYTVDEHIFTAMDELCAIARGERAESLPLATSLYPPLLEDATRRRALHVALFCHDIGKGRCAPGTSPQKRTDIGVGLARHVAKKLGLNKGEVSLVCWLVEHHQLLTDIAFKRDLHDPATIHYAADIIRWQERLHLLLLLCVADVRAVNPNVWNHWKASLLRQLYRSTEHYLRTGVPMLAFNKEALFTFLQDQCPHHSASIIHRYLLSYSPEDLHSATMPEHAHILDLSEKITQNQAPFALQLLDASTLKGFSNVTQELLIVAPDRVGLLAAVSAALFTAQIHVVGARLITLTSGLAAEIWQVQNQCQQPLDPQHDIARIERALQEHIHKDEHLKTEAIRPALHRNVSGTREEISIFNTQSATCSIIEIYAHDRPGLLYDITQVLAAERLDITSAHINTYGLQAVDVFYVKDAYGFKLSHPARISTIKKRLRKMLDHPWIANG